MIKRCNKILRNIMIDDKIVYLIAKDLKFIISGRFPSSNLIFNYFLLLIKKFFLL